MDLKIVETLSGGDIFSNEKDLVLCQDIENVLYICLFGGNVKASTKGDEQQSQQRFDWWGNSLLFSAQKQFNSETERTLNESNTNSKGRTKVMEAISKDIEFLRNIYNIQFEVYVFQNRFDLHFKISKGDINSEFTYKYDTINQQLFL